MIDLGILRFFSVFGDIESQPNCTQKCQAQKPEKLEVYPNIHAERVRDEKIDKTDRHQKDEAKVLYFSPGKVGHGDTGKNCFDVLLFGESTEKKNRSKKPVQERRLPLNESRILESNRHAAE